MVGAEADCSGLQKESDLTKCKLPIGDNSLLKKKKKKKLCCEGKAKKYGGGLKEGLSLDRREMGTFMSPVGET